MIVECSTCHAKYNVDESKIPAAGVKVRCHKCQTVIIIKREVPAPSPVPIVEPSQLAAPEVSPPPPQVAKPPEPKPEPEPTPPPIPPKPEVIVKPQVPEKIPEPVVTPQPKLEIETTAKPVTPPETAGLSDEDKKWHERARRLAKALASDLVLYNTDKVERGLRDGTLVQLLGSEIRRSWEYYCQQIPKHIVDASDYFKEQLNKIVGKGKELFK